MEEPKPLNTLFDKKIFRIPDYQRGYAWGSEQWKDFWEDLVNLGDDRVHYTGVLTLKAQAKPKPRTKEYWLAEDHSYKLYHVVDGQQRLTTFVIFLQAMVDFLKAIPENVGKRDAEIYLSETQSVADVQDAFLFKVKPTGDRFRTYLFGYTEDNPSYEFLRYRIFGEDGGGKIQESFYTLNLMEGKRYFSEQLDEMNQSEGLEGVQGIFKKLTKCFLLNEYIIRDEFDVFVAFETMNNRGKRLSDLELLKNRLIYLTTLYNGNELDEASRQSIRETINDGWKEVYHQLGRNPERPLNDNDFLRAHWILYYMYSRNTGRDYINFLLNQEFAPKRVHKKVEREVEVATGEEQRSEDDYADPEDDSDAEEPSMVDVRPDLSPQEISDYVLSLKSAAVHWFNSHFPFQASELSEEEAQWVDALNRIGMNYFRPLVMAILKRRLSAEERVKAMKAIERAIFIVFRLNEERSNFGSSTFNRIVRDFDREEVSVDALIGELDSWTAYAFEEGAGVFKGLGFKAQMEKRFTHQHGYFSWPGLLYFLFEYERSLLAESRQGKVDWKEIRKHKRDLVSIEHIFPQTPTEAWKSVFERIPEKKWPIYQGSLGNLLILSQSINSSLQNISFPEKKAPKFDQNGRKIRNGYSDGSHSEIEVSRYDSWGPEEIRDRGLKLIQFMEERWDIDFGSDERRLEMLFLGDPESLEGKQ